MSVFDNQPKTASMKYVLITPARNEAQFIGVTIQSMIHQTAKPLKWIIVSDGSTDGTDDIVVQHAKDHCWIELVRRPERTERHFAGKVMAFNEGYSRVRRLDCDVIGNLDADISFDPDYFGFLMSKFAGDDRSESRGRLSVKERNNTTISSRALNMCPAHASFSGDSVSRKSADIFR